MLVGLPSREVTAPPVLQFEPGVDDAGAPAADLPPLLAALLDSYGFGMRLGQAAQVGVKEAGTFGGRSGDDITRV